jgi:hypothetical protein
VALSQRLPLPPRCTSDMRIRGTPAPLAKEQ